MKVIWVLLGYLLCAVTVTAQYPYYHSITTEEGLPSNEVYSIVQDKQGFIWIGSDVGLVRYNGIAFKQYKNEGQRSRIVAGLIISASGRIYGNNFNNQIFYFENDSLYELKGWQGGITNIATGPDGRLWVVGQNGLGIYNEQTQTWQHKDSSYANPARGIHFDEDGAAWYLDLHNMQVGHIANGKIDFYQAQNTEGPKFTIAVHLLSVGKIGKWLVSVSNGEVYKFDGKAFVPFVSKSLSEAIRGRKCNQVIQMADGKLWFCTFSGIVSYDPATDKTEVLYEGVSFSNAMQDREGGIWLASLHKGLFYIPDMRFISWNSAYDAMPSNSITQLFLQKENLYYATSDGHYGTMNVDRRVFQNHYLGVRADISGLYYDTISNTLVFNSSSSLYYYSKGKVNQVLNSTPPIKSILRVGDQLYYASSFGLYVGDTTIGDSGLEKLTDVWSRDLVYKANSKKLWVATDSGITVLHTPTKGFDTTLLGGKQVISIAADIEKVYALLYTGQVVTIGQDYTTQVIATLPNEANGADLEIASGKIWVATNQGVMMFSLTTKQWQKIDKILGLASNDVKALGQYKNEMWLATGNGLQTIPLDYTNDKPAAIVYLALLAVNGQPHKSSAPLLLAYKDVVGFVPEASAYSSMGKYQYAYRVLQGDTAWQLLPANTQQFSLTGISPGDFTFQLKVIDHWGRDSESIIGISGHMQAPFWQRWWFYVLLSATGVFLAFIGFKYRLRTIRRKQEHELERMQLQSELELSQQAALKAQMNPHFIFNVLNSIKSYIYENDKKSAAEYLSTFAKLIRRILTMSGEANVSLEEELDALDLYIQLEAMLLEPPFDYITVIDPKIDLHAVRIPSLLIQPYIENAFIHGLRHQQGTKQLTIAISINKGNLQISIADNGIGRIAAEILNRDRVPGHQSFATNANEKRLALLNQSKAKSVDVVYIDKTDNLGKPIGTEVIITVKPT